jgi:hypothetical protein
MPQGWASKDSLLPLGLQGPGKEEIAGPQRETCGEVPDRSCDLKERGIDNSPTGKEWGGGTNTLTSLPSPSLHCHHGSWVGIQAIQVILPEMEQGGGQWEYGGSKGKYEDMQHIPLLPCHSSDERWQELSRLNQALQAFCNNLTYFSLLPSCPHMSLHSDSACLLYVLYVLNKF